MENGAARGIEARTARRASRDRAGARGGQRRGRAAHAGAAAALGRRARRRSASTCACIPVMVVWGQMDEEVRPWEGMLSATFSDQHADMDGRLRRQVRARGHPAQHPAELLALARRPGAPRELMQALPYTGRHGRAAARPRRGRGAVGRDGEPIVRYAFTDRDVRAPARGHRGRRGAGGGDGRQLDLLVAPEWVAYEPGRSGDRDELHARRRRLRLGAGQAQTGVLPHHGQRAHGRLAETDSVCDPTGQTWAVRGLYVCDGSAFPTAAGVNPMVTIEALAHMNARGLAERLA